MLLAFLSRAPSVLSRASSDPVRRIAPANLAPTVGRSYQVLQSRSAPAQLSLFLRPGAYDVK
ncbi:MAG: hypothetical protein JF606_15010 [Burkholderiales bacterium]|jgi:hypothetical protein|nr:hypothetical protein [Burkholderiales bacterium]